MNGKNCEKVWIHILHKKEVSSIKISNSLMVQKQSAQSSVHDLDKHRIDSPVITLIEDVDVIKTIEAISNIFWSLYWSKDRCSFFPPTIRCFSPFADLTIRVIIQTYPVTSKASVNFKHIFHHLSSLFLFQEIC